jgi:4-hydroxy-3-polyprenylbenzoate decarboxylase
MRIVVGITGASGTIYAQRLVEKLSKKVDLEIVISEIGKQVIEHENPEFLTNLGEFGKVYEINNFNVSIASGSHLFDAMIIIPCSMKTLGLIANGIANNLIIRAAEVCIKEKRKLILCPRESPLSPIHLENMSNLSKLGIIIAPLMPSFYTKPKTIDDLIENTINRVLDLLGLPVEDAKRWSNNF